MLNLPFIISFTVSYVVMNVAHSRAVQSDNTDFSLTQILLLGNITFNTKVNTKIINLTTLFCQLRDLMSHFYGLYIFFLSSPLNNDSSANKKILSEASPGLLGHQQLFTGQYPLDTTTLSSFFDVMKVLDSLLLIFVEDPFVLIKKFQFVLNQMLLNLIVFKFTPDILK